MAGNVSLRTKRAKAIIEQTFDRMGGVNSFVHWAKENPGEFYTKVYIKLLPLQIKGQINHTAKTSVHQFSKHELEAIAARGLPDIAGQIESDGKPH